MKYLSIKEFAEIWGVSPTMVRKYCLQNRIPGAKRKDGVWIIPDTAKKPEAKVSTGSRFEKLPPLAYQDYPILQPYGHTSKYQLHNNHPPAFPLP